MLEPIEDQYVNIGHIVRSHGVKGEVVLRPALELPDLLDRLQLVHIEGARGELVPARIESYRVQQKGKELSFFVKFEHISDRDAAGLIKDSAVYADRSDMPEEETPSGQPDRIDLISFEVYGEESLFGTVTGVMESPAHPILEVERVEGGHLLIPFVEEYVSSVNGQERTITCRRLEQLMDE